MFLAAVIGCVRHDAPSLAERADATYHTGIFTWLDGHDPSAVVLWHVPPAIARKIVPGARFDLAGSDPCREARAGHAVLMLLAPESDRVERARAQDCGFAIVRDRGGLVVAPL